MDTLVTGLVKAAFATYDYQGSVSRNYTPERVKNPKVKEQAEWEQKRFKLPKTQTPGLLAWGTNKPVHIFDNPTMRSRTPLTISGTGSGNQYWAPITNPFDQ